MPLNGHDLECRLVLRFAFKQMAKGNDFIAIDDIGDAFRYTGQNPSDETVRDMTDKARMFKSGSAEETGA